MVINEEAISRLGEVLGLARQSLGWSTERLAVEIGVTRQTVNNLESGRGRLSKTQYMALRCLFDDEMENHPDETEMLATLLEVFVDHPEKYDEDKRKQIRDSIAVLAPGVGNDPQKRKDASRTWKAVLVGLGVLFPVQTLTAIAVSNWKKN